VSNCRPISGLLEEEAELEKRLLTKKVGCVGIGNGMVVVSLSSMNKTFDIVGRSIGSS